PSLSQPVAAKCKVAGDESSPDRQRVRRLFRRSANGYAIGEPFRRFGGMRNPKRKIAFVLAASDHGTMIVNRVDYRMVDERGGIGVGFQILEKASFDALEVDMALSLLGLRRKYFGDGVLAIDCGANIGVHTIEWANRMHGWGEVVAIEAQERVF